MFHFGNIKFSIAEKLHTNCTCSIKTYLKRSILLTGNDGNVVGSG